MSNFRGHAFGGVIAFIAFVFAAPMWFILNIEQFATCFIVCCAFAVWPDVDIHSKGQAFFYRLFLLLDLVLISYGKYKYAAVLGIFAMLPIVGKHRGWTHSILAALIVPIIFLLTIRHFYPSEVRVWTAYYIASLFGYFSHLICDRKLKIL